ncbi:hypothetical protein AQUCO_00100630v1 [Aquilegia coerulea]|uniref:Zinc finger PHD-type domain-containing protein n=1 Tax=Aquilegia coerulea TaxID=218851 RepID=A0A2G5FB84_AQUCA|nr:hypothetical protein AQUCO_00100630v1 [Aquilegia coerulea]
MEFSDDEGETVAQSVSTYHFVDDKDELISFSVLPVQWCEDEKLDSINNVVFLSGTADDGFQKIYKQVTAWKFDLSDLQPQVSVLSKEGNWIKLLKPRKSFEDTVRTILVTLHCLHFVKKNPEVMRKPLWDRLRKIFSSYEVVPSENDLLDHLPLIKAAVEQDEILSKSQYLTEFLENPLQRSTFDEDTHSGLDAKRDFIADDDEDFDEIGAADEETELFDSVCAFCDNGGELLCCEGRCIRSFHATVDAGVESNCKSLGLTNDQVKAMQTFLCLNCQQSKHQCFACGKLGSSDKSLGPEVFHCVSATCGYFYHPECVAKLLHPLDEAEAEELQKRISGGESFTCPAHRCRKCNQGENKDIRELQFAVCRRCPRAYHRQCLPKKIVFDGSEGDDLARAWDGLLPNNRVLIYCLRHKIDENLETPIRNHIIFPGVGEKKDARLLDLLSRKRKALEKRSIGTEDLPKERIVSKVPKLGMSSDVKHSDSIMKRDKLEKSFLESEKPKVPDVSRKHFRDSMKRDMSSAADKFRVSSGKERFDSSSMKKPISSRPDGITKSAPPKTSTTVTLDEVRKKKIMSIMERTKSSVTLEDVVRSHNLPSTYATSLKNVVDKIITQGKVEGSVEAVRAALQKLEAGCSVDDARQICEPEIIKQLFRWKSKLKVYLAPFIHGKRYTSFGRHFTKVEKLKEIVDKLHWYTQDGDTIVDFCCGANDFSCIMKQKLEETGKRRCSFKNFDIIQPKNDFCFEKRDWMTVRPNELPKGDNLIMGLNPPFGVKASLANSFIDNALKCNPKLLILIVPPETERLDRKKLASAYDLIWEDDQQLSGKSFYLPGSVDVNDNQMEQWNNKPPPLYLWSRSDWTVRHKATALKRGHLCKEQEGLLMTGNYSEVQGHTCKDVEDSHMKENYSEVQFSEDMDISPVHDYCEKVNQNKSMPERIVPSIQDSNREYHSYQRKSSQQSSQQSLAGEDKGKHSRHMAEIQADSRNSVEGHSNEALDISNREASEDVQHFQPCVSGLEYRTGYSDMGCEDPNGSARRYSSDGIALTRGDTSMGTNFGQQYNVRGVDYSQTAYTTELDEHRKRTDIHQLLRQYGGASTGPLFPSNHYPSQDGVYGGVGSVSTPYRLSSLVPESAYGRVNSSTMQRYAPRLDELNHVRNGIGGQMPLNGGGSMFDTLGSQYTPGSYPGNRPNISGFAPGPPRPSSHHNSSGWLND